MARPPPGTRKLVDAALREDLGRAGDVTSRATLPPDCRARARIVARESGILAGIQTAALVFKRVDSDLRVRILAAEGRRFPKGAALLEVSGGARSILAAERTALNFLGHLCGVATATRAFVERTRGTRARIYDTRKTTPLLRALEKQAVASGGGRNHRMGLYDAVLIKDNHVEAAGSVRDAVRRARRRLGRGIPIQVECDSLSQVGEALDAGADLILCDNMSPGELRRAVRKARGRVPVEASGGITLKTARAVASTGVDRISVGAITHGARQIDLGLDFLPEEKRRTARR